MKKLFLVLALVFAVNLASQIPAKAGWWIGFPLPIPVPVPAYYGPGPGWYGPGYTMVGVIIGGLPATATTGIHIGAVVIGTAAAGIIGKRCRIRPDRLADLISARKMR